MLILALLFLLQSLICNIDSANSEPKKIAFPGAEGFGKYASGGRGGLVYIVTNLNDSGLGSLRWAIEAEGPRTVVFEVSGTIELKSNLSIRGKNKDLTIAGQTAPGDGITLKNHPLIIRNSRNIIIRFLRFRPGDLAKVEHDALTIRSDTGGSAPEDIVIDHCSFSWGTDETFSIGNGKNITIQNNIIAEGLNSSVNGKGAHGFGGIIAGQNISVLRNLFSHFTQRNPQFQKGSDFQRFESLIDFRNNLIYNWAFRSSDGGSNSNVNLYSNYYKAGPATFAVNAFPNHFLNGLRANKDSNTYGRFYLSGNKLLHRPEVLEDQWKGVRLESGNLTREFLEQLKNKDQNGNLVPFPIPSAIYSNTLSADEACETVLSLAGASLMRDAVDKRLVQEARTGTTTYKGSKTGIPGIIDSQSDVGGWPELTSLSAPKDTDRDGMPDFWEIEMGLNPKRRDDRFYDLDSNYTNLEVYLNGLVAHIMEK